MVFDVFWIVVKTTGDEWEDEDEEPVDREGSLVQEYFPGHVDFDQKSGVANLSTRSSFYWLSLDVFGQWVTDGIWLNLDVGKKHYCIQGVQPLSSVEIIAWILPSKKLSILLNSQKL